MCAELLECMCRSRECCWSFTWPLNRQTAHFYVHLCVRVVPCTVRIYRHLHMFVVCAATRIHCRTRILLRRDGAELGAPLWHARRYSVSCLNSGKPEAATGESLEIATRDNHKRRAIDSRTHSVSVPAKVGVWVFAFHF